MKPSLLTKLETLADRHEEVSALLSDGETIADQERFRNLSREYSELEDVVRCYGLYSRVRRDLDEARQMLDDPDPEVREMAREEVEAGRLVTLPLAPEPMLRRVGLIYRKDKALSKAALGFIQVMLEHAAASGITEDGPRTRPAAG